MVVDVIDATAKTVTKAGLGIKNVDEATGTVTFDGTTTATVGDLIVTSGSYNLEISGLGKIMTVDNTLYGLDRSTNSWFNPGTLTASSSVLLDDDLMEKAIQRVDMKSGKKPEIIIGGYLATRVLKNYLAQYQRYTTIDTRYDAGHSTMSYDGIPC